jgi:hypothetical protein
LAPEIIELLRFEDVATVAGEQAYDRLAAIPKSEAVDFVDVFRRADQAGFSSLGTSTAARKTGALPPGPLSP